MICKSTQFGSSPAGSSSVSHGLSSSNSALGARSRQNPRAHTADGVPSVHLVAVQDLRQQLQAHCHFDGIFHIWRLVGVPSVTCAVVDQGSARTPAL